MSRWKTEERKIIYDKAVLLTEDRVIDPGGHSSTRNTIKVKEGSVVIIARNVLGEFILVGQHRYATDTYSWEFPNGGIENDEKPEQAANRELGEETGLTSKHWIYLGYFYPVNSLMNREVYVFLADKAELADNKDIFQPENYEKLSVRKVNHDELKNMVAENIIKDSFTLSALAFLLFSN